MGLISSSLKKMSYGSMQLYMALPKLLIKMFPGKASMGALNRIYESMPIRSIIKMKDASNIDTSFIIEVYNYDTMYRVKSFFSKEPLTLDWISKMKKGSVLWDIGANIGLYSLYAAKLDISVIAFEPSHANYYALNRNIFINKCDQKIKAYCTALSDSNQFGSFNMGDVSLGGAFYQYSNDALDDFYYPGVGDSKVMYRQGSLAIKIDDAVSMFALEFPNYIKIDVDGIEKAIINGGLGIFKNENLKEILIEINTNEDFKYISDYLTSCSFELKAKEYCDGEIYNYLFVKKELHV